MTQSPSLKNAFDVNIADSEVLSDTRIDRILGAVRNHLGLEIAFVSRYVDEQRQLTHISTDLDLPMGPGYSEPQEDSYCWHIMQGDLPELIQDSADFPLAQKLPATHALPVGCHLNVPLRLSDGTVYGSFCALSRAPDRSMTQRDIGVLKAFAELATEQIESNLDSDVRRSMLQDGITELIASNQMTIFHQPIHFLSDNTTAGVECLARFPDAGQRGPDSWFNEADEIGMGIELEMLAVRSALATLPYVPSGHYVSINASPTTIISGALEEALADQEGQQLVIEVTEHQEVTDFGALAKALRTISPKARIAIDDVGAGYAGLRHIVDLQPDILKLDMSLTRDVFRDPARRALAGALVAFGEEIGCTLVAEGIECAQERDIMADLGITYGQGYFYSRPLPVVASQQWLLGVQSADVITDADLASSGNTNPAAALDITRLRA